MNDPRYEDQRYAGHYHGAILASIPGFGQVYDCGNCGNLHLQIGPMNLTLEPKAYMQLVDLVSTSAANFELWLQQKSGHASDADAEQQADHTQDFS
jgi:hypothetical protein